MKFVVEVRGQGIEDAGADMTARYIMEAVSQWGGGYPPDDDFFPRNWENKDVKVAPLTAMKDLDADELLQRADAFVEEVLPQARHLVLDVGNLNELCILISRLKHERKKADGT